MSQDANKVLVETNQFGEKSANYVGSDGILFLHDFKVFSGATAPVDGTTGLNVAGKGSIYSARDTGAVYTNTGTKASPAWTILEAGSASVLGTLLAGYSSGAGTVSASDSILSAFNKLNGNAVAIKATADAALPSASFTSAAVTAKLLTGFVSGAGVVAATDTVLSAFNKLDGNAAAIKVTADAALPSASFTAAAVTGKLLTGLSAAAGVLAGTDSILAAFNKLAGNVAAHQADSTASDVPGLVVDFNLLLAKLQAANLMA